MGGGWAPTVPSSCAGIRRRVAGRAAGVEHRGRRRRPCGRVLADGGVVRGGLGLPASVSMCAKRSCIVFANIGESAESAQLRTEQQRGPEGQPGELPKHGCRQGQDRKPARAG